MIDDLILKQEPLVEVRHLSVAFGQQSILRDINFTIPAGQTIALLGESGCGKTVLMKAIIGLIQPTIGQVLFDSDDLSKLTDRELSQLRLRFGFVFQNAALFDSMTVGQNVAFPLRQHGRFNNAEIREMVLSRLSEVGLPDSVVYKKPAELSGGMRKRVGLARALIIRTRRRNPVTSIVVTHDMITARKVADRVIMLLPLSRVDPDENQIIFDGTPEELSACRDRRVQQFVNGEAGERLMELRANQTT